MYRKESTHCTGFHLCKSEHFTKFLHLTAEHLLQISETLNNIALLNKSSQSYRPSLAICDYTVLPVTRHKWTRPT